MMCHMIGLPPISTIGFGLTWVSSLRREPNPPARMTVFIAQLSAVELLPLQRLTSASLRLDARVLGRPIQHRPDPASEVTPTIAARCVAPHVVADLTPDDA